MNNNQSFLVIDDDQVFNQTLCRTLNRRNKETYSAETMLEAVDAIDQHKPDCAVLDLNLGDEHGIDFIAPMLAKHPKLKIVVLTGYASLTTAVEAIKMGAWHYLAKPADVDTILRALQSDEDKKENKKEELLPLPLENLEWEHLQRVLADNDGNISITARKLGMHRRTLQRKLQKKNIYRNRAE